MDYSTTFNASERQSSPDHSLSEGLTERYQVSSEQVYESSEGLVECAEGENRDALSAVTTAPMEVVVRDDASHGNAQETIMELSSQVQMRVSYSPPPKAETGMNKNKALADTRVISAQQFEAQTKELNTVIRDRMRIAEANAVLRQECEAQENQNKALRRDNEMLKKALEQRTTELYGVEKFFTTADKFSGSEVVRTLRRLNEGVQQNTTFMAEWAVRNLSFEIPYVHQRSTHIEQAKVEGSLGVRFMRTLKARKQVDNPILVEIAFQAYLMYELCQHTCQRLIQGDQSHSMFIDGIYRRMREGEGQAISGNWRALTHRYASSTRTEGLDFVRMMETEIIFGLSVILLVAGCTNSKPDIISALRSKFADMIRNFISLARDINTIISAGVISEDLEVMLIPPGTPFDRDVMQDWDGQETPTATGGRQESVLCTIELGLVKRTKAAATGKRYEVLNTVMVKPKVALVSILDIIEGQ